MATHYGACPIHGDHCHSGSRHEGKIVRMESQAADPLHPGKFLEARNAFAIASCAESHVVVVVGSLPESGICWESRFCMTPEEAKVLVSELRKSLASLGVR